MRTHYVTMHKYRTCDEHLPFPKYMVAIPRRKRRLPLGRSGRKPVAFCGHLCLFHDGTISEGLLPSTANFTPRSPYRSVSQLISVELNSREVTKPAGFLLGGRGPITTEKNEISSIGKEPSTLPLWKSVSVILYSLTFSSFLVWLAFVDDAGALDTVMIFPFIALVIMPEISTLWSIQDGGAGSLFPGPLRYRYAEIEMRVVGESETDRFRLKSSGQLSQEAIHEWAIATCTALVLVAILNSWIGEFVIETHQDEFNAIYFATSLILLLICFGDYLGVIFPPSSISLWLGGLMGREEINEEVFAESSAFEFFELYLDLIKDNSEYEENVELSVIDLLSSNESQFLEFKGSMWSLYKGKNYQAVEGQTKKSFVLQDSIVKTIAGFLNTDGGTLLIGVADKPRSAGGELATVVGIEGDFRWLKKGRQDIEGYSHALNQILNNALGDESTTKLHINVTFPEHLGLTLCRIDVQPLPRSINGEIYVKTKTMGDEEFFFRASDTTTHASVKSANRYIRHHFEGFSGANNDDSP